MPTYHERGIEFDYPDDWRVSEDESDSGRSITVQSPGTTFWSLTLLPDRPTAEEAVEAAVEAFRDEYPQLDVYEPSLSLTDAGVAGCDLDFVFVDLVGSAGIRAIELGPQTALVVYQGEDREFDHYEPILAAMTAKAFGWDAKPDA